MRKLAVIFPGIGYTADKPLLYYARRLAREAGYAERLISYEGFPKGVLGDREKMAESYRLALSRTREQLREEDLRDWDRILFIGKSIGTILAAKIARESACREKIALLLYTPMEDTFRFCPERALVFTGTADPWVGGPESRIPALCEENRVPCRVIPGGNHSLETGDLQADLNILRQVMEATARFLAEEQGPGCGPERS